MPGDRVDLSDITSCQSLQHKLSLSPVSLLP